MTGKNFWLDRKKDKESKKQIQKRLIGMLYRNDVPKVIPVKKNAGN